MKLRVAAVVLLMLFAAALIPHQASAGYTMAISGKSEFTALPYVAQVFNGTDVYVRIYLTEYSPGPLDIEITKEGELAQYITFPDFSGNPTFTLLPSQSRMIRYVLNLPASSPGKYYGGIVATGTPPDDTVSEGMGAAGRPVVAVSITVDVPSEVQIFDFMTAKPSGFPDQQWSTWGNSWMSNFSVVNGGDVNFTGYCNVTLSAAGAVVQYENFTITNLSVGGTLTHSTMWSVTLALGTVYTAQAIVYSDASEKKDDESLVFRVPTPADILAVERTPNIVYSGNVVTVSAVLASSDSAVTLHWQNGASGAENTETMVYSSTTGRFVAAIPGQAFDSTVYYWLTSANDVYSDVSPDTGKYFYYVFALDVPDFIIDQNSINFIPLDPTVQQLNETNGTNIYITVRNTGQGDGANVNVRVFDGETAIWNATLPSILGGGNSETVYFNWRPLEGTHVLRFSVDPDNEILEISEDNNDYSVQIQVYPAPPAPEPEEEGLGGILPYVLIPIIILVVIFLILFLRRKKGFRVKVLAVKEFTLPRDGSVRRQLTCGYGEDKTIGVTESTDLEVKVGSVVLVMPQGVLEDEEGNLAWRKARVLKVLEGEKIDTEQTIRKYIKEEKEEKKE